MQDVSALYSKPSANNAVYQVMKAYTAEKSCTTELVLRESSSKAAIRKY